jgi:hypothetical protein
MKKIKIVSKRAPLGYSWYQLPPFLQGRITVQAYRVWLAHKAHTMHERDVELKTALCLDKFKRSV